MAALLLLFLMLAAPAVPARAAEGDPPSFQNDIVVLRLSPAATGAAWQTRADRTTQTGVSSLRPLRALGVPDLDRIATGLGVVEFEPEFPTDAPAPGVVPDPLAAFWIAHLPDGAQASDARTAFQTSADVASASLSGMCPVSAVPDDPYWPNSYYFYQPSRHDIHAVEGWDVTTGDSSVVVAVLDTGVIPYHPDLAAGPGYSSQIWTNLSELNGTPGVDDDNNGYVDDVHGWDFVNLPNPVDTGVVPGEDWFAPDNDPNDFAGHGTAVAGVIGAHGNNAMGATGTAWKVSLMPLRVAWATTASPLGQVSLTYVAQAIRYATRMGALIINCSFESRYQEDLAAALDNALANRVTIVVAAGNKGTDSHYIGDREEVLTVTSTDQFDVIPRFANAQGYVDVAAPGTSLITTTVSPHPAHVVGDSLLQRRPTYTTGATGTSFSAALVSGMAALYQAHRLQRGLTPALPFEVQQRVVETADDISAQNPGVTGYGTGRVNLNRMLRDPPTSSVVLENDTVVGPGVPLPPAGRPCCAAVALADSRIVIVDVGSASVRSTFALPAPPLGGIAAADLGGTQGFAMFVATTDGRIAGFRADGKPLPGWPVTATPNNVPGTMPALGDIDGDGGLEVVWGGSDDRIYAWHPDGSPVTGFPLAADSTTATVTLPNVQIALSNFDGQPGVEIVALTSAGYLNLLRGNGTTMPGWPIFTIGNPEPPSVVRFGNDPTPTIVVASGPVTYAFNADGTRRSQYFQFSLAASEPVIGDLNGDGVDEIILSRIIPTELTVLGADGLPVHFGTWPKKYAVNPVGTPLMGHVSPTGAPTVVWTLPASGVYAYDSSTAVLFGYPKAGRAASQASIWDYDGDRRTEILGGPIGGTGLYIYKMAPGSWRGTKQGWPTPRGNFARTGSADYNPGAHEDTPTLIALATASAEPGRVHVEWQAGPGITVATVERREGAGPWRAVANLTTDGAGRLRYDDHDARPGAQLGYRLRVVLGGVEVRLGEVELMVPQTVAFTLAGARPNPAEGSGLAVAFTLPAAAPARLEVFDLAGRRRAALDVGALGAGSHVVAIPARLAPGIYLLRLLQSGAERHARCAIVR